MTAIERTKKRISSLIDWLRDLQSVDPQADRDYPEDLYNLAIDDLHAISFEYQTLAREVERLKAELVRKADELQKQYRWHHLATEAFAAEKDATAQELRKVETECSMLRVECGLLERNAETTYENHKRIVAELTAERDEARREICTHATNEPFRQMCGSGILLPQDAARERGWDCFG
jgi:hypothetical protein